MPLYALLPQPLARQLLLRNLCNARDARKGNDHCLRPGTALGAVCYTRAMKHLRWVLLVLIILLLGTSGLAAWAYAHRGYPNAVYYARLDLSMGGSTAHTESWIDPKGVREIVQRTGGRFRNIIRYGRVYDVWNWGQVRHTFDTPTYFMPLLSHLSQELQQGGYRAVGRASLRRAIGRVKQVRFNGYSALEFPPAN
jgi:hypothetical protein